MNGHTQIDAGSDMPAATVAHVQPAHAPWGQIIQLIFPYFRSEHHRYVWAMVLTVLVLTITGAVLERVHAEWAGHVSTAMQQRNAETFWGLLKWFPLLLIGVVLAAVYAFYLGELFELRWRKWFTERYLQRWMSQHTFYRMELARNAPGQHTPDNPDQRIQEDVNKFTQLTVLLVKGLVGAVFVLALFMGMLWGVSDEVDIVLPQALGGWRLDVPGLMVWVALAYAGLGTMVTFWLGRPQQQLNYDAQRLEANFRHHLVRVRHNAEAIALDRGSAVEGAQLQGRLHAALDTVRTLIQKKKNLLWFTVFYSLISGVFVDLLLAPNYFRGEIEMGTLTTTSMAFMAVQGSLSWLVNNYVQLAVWRATGSRLVGFEAAFAKHAATDQSAGIAPEASDSNAPPVLGADAVPLQAKLNHIALPTGQMVLVATQLRAQSGQRILLEGPSGSGKSTLLRVLAGIWPHSEGQVVLPAHSMFVPQRPYFPEGRLRVALSYPEPLSNYSDAQLQQALEQACLPSLVGRLDDVQVWEDALSGGEKQRLAVARVLLKQPAWVFADEITSAMDNATEARVYEALVRMVQAQGGGLVSVAHRSTVRPYHDTVWQLDPQQQTLRTYAMDQVT